MNIRPIVLFWLLVLTFVVIVFGIITKYIRGSVFIIGAGVVFFILGLALILFAQRNEKNEKLKKFLMLTGGSVIGFFVSIIMHNLFYGLSVFAGDFKPLWYLTEVLHIFFFVMTVIIMPLLFLAGTVGVVVIKFKKHKYEKS